MRINGHLTNNEMNQLNSSFHKLDDLRNALNFSYLENADIFEIFNYFKRIKQVLDGINIDISFITYLMAKEYLSREFEISNFDVLEKSKTTPGHDIVAYTADSKKIIGTIQSMKPCTINNLDSKQFNDLQKDFTKLGQIDADQKFMFVTEESAYKILQEKYAKELIGITLVLLGKKKYNNEMRLSDFADEQLKIALLRIGLEPTLINAFRKIYEEKFGLSRNFIIYIFYNDDENDCIIQFYEEKIVVENVYSEKEEIKLEDARRFKYYVNIGDRILIPFDISIFTKEFIIPTLQSFINR